MANTYIILASDNGFLHGEHRRRGGKLVAYEPASHMPLIIRGPGFRPNRTYRQVVGLQDLAPTILTLTRQAGDQPVAAMDGISLYQRVTGALKPVATGAADRDTDQRRLSRSGDGAAS